MDANLVITKNKIIEKLLEIEKLFIERPKITIVIRMMPEDPESEVAITSETDWNKVRESINRAEKREKT